MLGRAEGVAVADEGQPAAGQRARPHVEDAVGQPGLALLRRAVVLRPVGGAGVRREGLVGEPDDLPRLDVDFVDIGTLERRQAELTGPFEAFYVRIIDPLAVEGNGGVGDGAVVAARDEQFLTAVGMKQHEVAARIHEGRMRDLGPQAGLFVAPARRADVNDVVVVPDGGVLGDGPRMDVDRIEEERLLVLGGGRRGDEDQGGGQQEERGVAELHSGDLGGSGWRDEEIIRRERASRLEHSDLAHRGRCRRLPGLAPLRRAA